MAGNKALWRVFFTGTLLSGGLTVVDITKVAAENGVSLMQPRWLLLLVGVVIFSLGAGTLYAFTWSNNFIKLERFLDTFLRLSARWKWLFAPLLLMAFFGVTFLEVQPYLSNVFENHFWVKVFFFQIFLFSGALSLRMFFPLLAWGDAFLVLALGQFFFYYISTKFAYFTNYPFALGWTTDSRHYYASLFFAERLYGEQLPLPILHPSLHLLLGIPFLFGDFPLIVHRLWNIFLTWGLTAGVALALLRRKYKEDQKLVYSLLFVWVFLYLVRVSVYVHLLLPTLLIFLFVSPHKKRQSWIVIIIASLWAGVSRINWFPVPAMLAALIYFLDVPQNERPLLDYIKLPALWFIAGVGSAFASQAVYIQLSGNGGRDEFYTSLSSDLLWYRLFPNETYAPGVLLGALFISLPLLLFAGQYLYQYRGNWKPIRVWGIFAIVVILFGGGLLVSAKIGGGADLHNMDAYFVSILLVVGVVFVRGFEPDFASEHLPGKLSFPVVATAIASFAVMLFSLRGSLPRHNWDWALPSLNDIQTQIARVAEQDGKVLFIAQRNFITFGVVDVPLVPEYEKDVLMEMAMSRNRSYLDQFYDALRKKEFGLIVTDPQSNSLIYEKRSFGIENNRWVQKVTRPLLCYYEPLALYEDVGVELYVPRTEPIDCE